jgi:hypothetical protein
MNAFIEKHKKHIIGVLSGWDRIVFRGTLRLVANLAGMYSYLAYRGILMEDFKEYAQQKTAQRIETSVAKAEQGGRPNVYLPSARTDKEQVALDIAARDKITEGLICILRTVEPCMYLEALATLDTSERVEGVIAPICRRRTSKGKSIRALRPWSPSDQQRLAAVSACGLAGDFRNGDIAVRLYPNADRGEDRVYRVRGTSGILDIRPDLPLLCWYPQRAKRMGSG